MDIFLIYDVLNDSRQSYFSTPVYLLIQHDNLRTIYGLPYTKVLFWIHPMTRFTNKP